MINQTEIERYLDDWLGNAAMAPADRVVVAVAVRIRRQKQRPAPRIAWALVDARRTARLLVGTRRLLAGAAAILVIALISVAALRFRPIPNVGLPSPAPTIVPTPAPTASASPGPTDPPGSEVFLANGVPDGWIVAASGSLSFRTAIEPGMGAEVLFNRRVMAADCTFGPEPGVETTAAGVIDAIARKRGLIATNEGPIEVGGLRGRRVDLALDPAIGTTCAIEGPGYVPLFGVETEMWEFVGLIVDERIRLIVLDAPHDQNVFIGLTAPDESLFERHIDDAMTIVGNLNFLFD